MCGIIGAVSLGNQIVDIEKRMSEALNLLSHRGPDDRGFYGSLEHGVWFGHVRLSIVDLSEQGHQPMISPDGSISLVFNGEIYNHKSLRAQLISYGHIFRSNSDTEVFIESYRRWGIQCLDRLNGTFSFGLHDRQRQKVYIGRDRAGEKPLFYIIFKEVLYFASELTALMELSGCERYIDPHGLLSYLGRGYSLGQRTLLRDAQSMLPGHYATLDLEKHTIKIAKYWNLPNLNTDTSMLLDSSYEQQLELLLENAIKNQLDCDVPACILLSGGVDSSLITALAARQTSRVKTFTVRFPGHPDFDETEMARLIARSFNTDHTEIDGVDINPQILLDLGSRLDSPINDSSLIPTFLVYEAVSKTCRVALGGDGADELFGGYKHYSRMLALHPFAKRFPLRTSNHITRGFKSLIPNRFRFRNWLECFGMNLEYQVPNIREIFTPAEAGLLFNAGSVDIDLYESEWRALSSGHGSVLRNCSASDFQTYLPSSILVKSDRASMLNSVEARSPFLDRTVIDFSLSSLPDSLRATSDDRKIILKNLCAKILPSGFDLKRKLGFNLPFGAMIRMGEWREVVMDLLHTDNGVINTRYMSNLAKSHMSGSNYADQVFGLCMLSMWIKKNRMLI